jgi:hypothetical protein
MRGKGNKQNGNLFSGRGKIKDILKVQGQDQQFSLFNIAFVLCFFFLVLFSKSIFFLVLVLQ